MHSQRPGRRAVQRDAVAPLSATTPGGRARQPAAAAHLGRSSPPRPTGWVADMPAAKARARMMMTLEPASWHRPTPC
eukprot:scaffold71439_cov66-Phaeocystis_antarctica.AAC.2